MSLYKPFFYLLKTFDDQVTAHHNCNGGLNFSATSKPLDEDTVRLIELALEEGKRIRSREISELLSC